MDRALSLLNRPFSQPVDPGELDIPAVRGLGGSLLYFVDRKSRLADLWEVDFTTVNTGSSSSPPLLSRYDHISQSMHDEEMLTWLLFYTSLLDVTKTRVQDVVDPGGVVQSQVVATADGSLRLVLNASQSQRTLASRFVSQVFGAGVQHIALATDDIFGTVDRLQAAGVDLLRIPENYYDDLEARTDLSSVEVARLRESGILYDREGPAEYHQVYTTSLENGFFFEIVERRGYAGFGAANAPIRLAAQTRLAPAKMPTI
jgi:4-hydroxyphenylpyruvate dioxygenase